MLGSLAIAGLLWLGQEAAMPTVDEQLAAGAPWAQRGISDECLLEVATAAGASLDQPGMIEAARQRAQQAAGIDILADQMTQQGIILLVRSRANLEAASYYEGGPTERYTKRLSENTADLRRGYQQLWARRFRPTACKVFGWDGLGGLVLSTPITGSD